MQSQRVSLACERVEVAFVIVVGKFDFSEVVKPNAFDVFGSFQERLTLCLCDAREQ
jgi:hypothetical protein